MQFQKRVVKLKNTPQVINNRKTVLERYMEMHAGVYGGLNGFLVTLAPLGSHMNKHVEIALVN